MKDEDEKKKLNKILLSMFTNRGIYLSAIIYLCIQLGFEKIYITDTSCRGGSNLINETNNPMQPRKKKLVLPDEPEIGYTVNFVIPKTQKWSKVLGRVVKKEKKVYTIDTTKYYSGVKETKHSANHSWWWNHTHHQVGEQIYFVIPNTDVWSKKMGKVTKVYHNKKANTYTYDVTVLGEIFDKVTQVEDYIKTRTWIGGKKTKQKRGKQSCNTTLKHAILQ